MRFVVDAHLPPGLCGLLRAAGHDAIHTGDLPAANRTPDEAINQLAERDQRVVITKDTDFYHSHVLFGRPPKLLLIRTGNIGTRELKELVQRHLPTIVAALDTHSLLELDRAELRVLA